MKTLFTCVPGVGHLLPILPLARAAAADAEVTVSTHQGLAGLVTDLPFVGAGPAADQLMTENARRHRGRETGPVEQVADLFTSTRVQLTYEDALAVADRIAPDLIVADATDFVAPLVAARLQIPWVAHGVTAPPPPPLASGFAEGLAERHRERDLTPAPRLGLVDVWPDWLDPDGAPVPGDRWSMRPGDEPRAGSGRARRRPTVLVTLGTVVQNDELASAAVAAVVDLGLDAVVTIDPEVAEAAGWSSERVRAVGFTALADLLPDVDAVITVGGAGTVLATLGHGLPMVLVPRQADQPVVAGRVEAFGAGIVCTRDDEIRAALERVRSEDTFHLAADLAAERMRELDPAVRVWPRIVSALADRACAVNDRAGTGAG